VENSAKRGLRSVRDILQQTLFPDGLPLPNSATLTTTDPGPETWTGPTGRYDFDLAEFPFFHFDKNPDQPLKEPITYKDTITGKDGALVTREWKVYPSAAYGFGGTTTQLVLYDLLQLYIEQGKETKSSSVLFTTSFNDEGYAPPAPAITSAFAATLRSCAVADFTAKTPSGIANAKLTWI